MNRDTTHAWDYHDSTKHSYWSVRRNAHYLDWANAPAPFKVYPDLEPIALPTDIGRTGVTALEAIVGERMGSYSFLDFNCLAGLLYYSAGITKKKEHPQGTIYFRAAACAGALYPVEVYVVCGDIDGLPAGVYHFNPGDHGLRCLRRGDYRGVLINATADRESIASAPATFVYTAITWRSSWKYRARAYRYHFWDCGMILANAIAVSNAYGLPHDVVLGFVDEQVNNLLGVDGDREFALALLAVGEEGESMVQTSSIAPCSIPELALATLPVSASELEYTSISAMHRASVLRTGVEVEQWRHDRGTVRDDQKSIGESFPLAPTQEVQPTDREIEDVIVRRASTRRFAKKGLPFSDLSIILERATRGIRSDILPRFGEQLNEMYLIVNRVDGLSSGAYYYDRDGGSLVALKPGDFADEATYLVLDQELGGDASATIFFMARLDDILTRYGNRGYRVAQLESGIIGGKAYLASYAIGRGATGLTFYDDDVTKFFSPHAERKSCIFVMAVGIPGKRLVY